MTETLYTAYYAIGLLAYVFALISYAPFIVSFLRMAWRDSETRRMIFLRACNRLWAIAFLIDGWCLLTLEPNLEQFCEITQFMPDGRKLAAAFNVGFFDKATLMRLCLYRAQTYKLINLVVYHV